jgi:hypothetical protein
MRKLFVFFILPLLFCARSFALTLEAFAAFPLVLSDVSELPITYKANALGFGVSTLEGNAEFGLTATGVIYLPYTAESLRKTGGNVYGVENLFLVSLGFHLSLGCSVLVFNTKSLFFPVTISFHAKTDFLQTETHIDMGIAAAMGVTHPFWRMNFFARVEIFFDMYRIIIPQKGKLETMGPNVFGVIPQVGLGFRL